MRFAILFLLVLGCTALAQRRVIPHVAQPGGGFESRVLIANSAGKTGSYHLRAYEMFSGEAIAEAHGEIEANATQWKTIEELFGREEISHFEILSADGLNFAIRVKALQEQAAAVDIRESAQSANRWRFYLGDEAVSWDAMAVVNMGERETPLTFLAYDANDQYLGFISPYYPLLPNEKEGYLLSVMMADKPIAYWELSSPEPLAVLAFRGSLNKQFLWENAAIPMSTRETEKREPKP